MYIVMRDMPLAEFGNRIPVIALGSAGSRALRPLGVAISERLTGEGDETRFSYDGTASFDIGHAAPIHAVFADGRELRSDLLKFLTVQDELLAIAG